MSQQNKIDSYKPIQFEFDLPLVLFNWNLFLF